MAAMSSFLPAASIVAAVFGTAAWAVGLSVDDIDVRIPLVVGGGLSLASLAVYPAAGDWRSGAALGVVLVLYQCAIAHAVRLCGPMVQAIINCNLVIIMVAQMVSGALAATPHLIIATVAATTSAAALVLSTTRP